jgi:hypothetical protein
MRLSSLSERRNSALNYLSPIALALPGRLSARYPSADAGQRCRGGTAT